jgi:hypothetical protein
MIIAGLLACRNVLLPMYGPDGEGDNLARRPDPWQEYEPEAPERQ